MGKLNFEKTNILITGASSGIGKEFANQLAAKGANLILTARTQSDLKKLADELTLKHKNIWVKIVSVDLSQKNGAQTLFCTVNDMNLTVDYLINNAGVGKFCEFSGESFETYNNMLTLNINALVELTHLYLPRMKKKIRVELSMSPLLLLFNLYHIRRFMVQVKPLY